LRKARIATTWRLGFLVVDDQALVFAPTPEAHEPPPHPKLPEPNGVILRGEIVDLLLQPREGGIARPLLEPSVKTEGSEAKSNGSTSKAQQQTCGKIPSPRDMRKLAMVRRLFKVVRFQHSLNLADKKVRLTAKDFGLKTKDIDPQLSISFNIVSARHRKTLKAILNDFDKEVERMTKGGVIKSLHPHGYVVWYDEPTKFEEAFSKVQTQIENQIKKWFAKNYEKVEGDSRAFVKKFLRVDLYQRIKPEREPRHHGLSNEQFRDTWVDEQAAKFQLPSAEEVLKTLRIGCDRFDISEQLLSDGKFCSRLEEAFGVKLDELLDREEGES
jgi:hypothetical protein